MMWLLFLFPGTFAETLYEARGYSAGKCYSQIVHVNCEQEACVLEAFPNSKGSLTFTVESSAVTLNKETPRLHLADFQVTKNNVVRVLKLTPKFIREAEALAIGHGFLGRAVKCASPPSGLK